MTPATTRDRCPCPGRRLQNCEAKLRHDATAGTQAWPPRMCQWLAHLLMGTLLDSGATTPFGRGTEPQQGGVSQQSYAPGDAALSAECSARLQGERTSPGTAMYRAASSPSTTGGASVLQAGGPWRSEAMPRENTGTSYVRSYVQQFSDDADPKRS